MHLLRTLSSTLGLSAVLSLGGLAAQNPEPVVHAILFYSPTCPHCHQLITEHLIPLQNQYGNRLRILGMDTSQPWANNLYYEAIRFFKIPEDDWVVPILIVDQEVLVGGITIPQRLPTIIEEGLASGGIDLPNFPALVTFLQEQDLLDPRYPDRLMTRPAPPAEGTARPAAEGPPAPGDTVPAGDTARQEGVAERPVPSVVDSGPAGGVPVAADTGQMVDTAAAADTVDAPEPGAAVRQGEPVDSLLSADSAQPSAALPVSGPPPSDTGGEEPARSPGPEVAAGPDSAGESMGSLGLEEAARGLESMTPWDRFNADPAGNTLSVLVLLVMVVSLGLRGYPPRVTAREWPSWVVPALVAMGVGVAAYLSFIEVTQAEAVCGPVGDCNTVNQSEYARLFGVLPVGVLGLAGYGVILLLWLMRRRGPERWQRPATLGLWAAALFGTLFSVYLTFLEPFVIGATCAWCLTSALVMTLLLWVASPMAARVWSVSTLPTYAE